MITEAPDIAIRLARIEDRGFILELCARTFADLGDYRATVAGWLDGTDTVGIVAGTAPHQLGAALLAARRAIGFGRRPAAELLAIALHPGARGQGIGRLLLERAERIARGWDATEMRLHTADSNLRAQRFFSAAGYEPRPAKTTAYPSGETALAFARSLR
ncbi:GNAT family N-acetyltransferase [Candidatus Binatia bacterium]|nr:GNAT family N-acetyltransferase [Candidatus Binatia bacterium]